MQGSVEKIVCTAYFSVFSQFIVVLWNMNCNLKKKKIEHMSFEENTIKTSIIRS